MSRPAQDFWNGFPEEILVHIFSYLPLKDRHVAFHVCQRWAEAVHTISVWSYTEVSCNAEEMDQECVVQRLHQFLCHIKHLKIVLGGSREANRKHMTQILDMLIWQSHKVRALCIECCGKSVRFYSCKDILQSFSRLCLKDGTSELRYIDFRQASFILDNKMVLLIATSSPNLHSLLINNHPSKFLRPETIAKVLRTSPKLSVLGVHHTTLSEEVFQELLKPSRGPFHFLDIFCEGLNNNIPERLWSALIKKHPQLRVGLEFGLAVPSWKISSILKPNIPVTVLQFTYQYCMVRHIQFVTASYCRMLERLLLHATPSDDVNFSLIQLARKCMRLKEIHCFCAVSQAVIDAFFLYCPGLIRYTLSTH
ncbi:F-box/LRR-repeat protein 8-like [Hemicordylus capensis]|uniref:F-box/LRR-repeat protein 8-like n=1 Tax=Hemicordylus capensis TaxID=884348 RepID=UPI0023037A44|nr:F-box/LRR-repeat protein 8-like [Hemicordylus capensis]